MVMFEELTSRQRKVAVVGLGYVGLPLAVALARHFSVLGFDINEKRISELQSGEDRTREVAGEALRSVSIEYTADPARLKEAGFIIVAVPTPVDKGNLPDLTPVEKASETVGKNLTGGSTVVYESTVYPGVTEDICIPILEKFSGLKCGIDFKVGYSPERINPGDKEHTIDRVIKVVSGMDAESAELAARVYGSIAPIFKAASIKVAEAAKVIENTQRDLNIALMNELAVIFSRLGISVYDVLEAAGTKWNFLKFSPGLVGGHCIGVDPYYLTYKAQMLDYRPEVILAGRRINDDMGEWMTGEIVKRAAQLKKNIAGLKVLICGITFKENVPDVRNSKVYDMVLELRRYGIEPVVHDPLADAAEVKHEYGLTLALWPNGEQFDVVIAAVAHDQFKKIDVAEWKKIMAPERPLLADVKRVLDRQKIVEQGIEYWSL